MKKLNTKFIFLIALAILLSAVFAVAAFAATPGTGYCVDNSNNPTNIRWTMEESGTLTFEIDAKATDKVQTTKLFGKDPITGTTNGWNKNLPTFAEAVKIVIGDGITDIAGFSAMPYLKQVELAESVTAFVGAAFECSHSLSSVYLRGKTPVNGEFDLSNITTLSAYCFDGSNSMKSVVLNPNFKGEIPLECFKATALAEIEIPAGTIVINNNAFMKTENLKVVTILGMETRFSSDNVFKDNTKYPAIKAKANSKAAEFAKANGYTFIDLDTGETIKGTKPTMGASDEGSEGGASGGSTTTPAISDFKGEGSTIWGHSSGKYNGSDIINTWWAYYDETKTLEFISATTKYNETGGMGDVDADYTNWAEYKDVIEHIIIGDNIVKISNKSFQNYPALKDVRIGKDITQIDVGAFTGCSALTTIWRNGTERIEGRADFTGLQKVNDIIPGTAISEVVLPAGTKSLGVDLPPSVKTIYTNEITAELIEYAKTNLFNLQSLADPNVKHEYWVYVDPTLPACGGRSVFGFDEATGVLTVYGAGVIDDIVNYYGGGSKNQPWFDIKNSVKHIVISDRITAIGKYAFCEFLNLETVQIPATEGFIIMNAAFEKCSKLRSIYHSGSEPIEGTLDLRNVHELNSWTFAYDHLIANVVISPQVAKIGTSVFEENVNFVNVYGTPGSFSEIYAAENGKTFYDIALSTPEPISCTPPETTVSTEETTTEAPEATDAHDTAEAPETSGSASDSETVAQAPTINFVDEDDISASENSIVFPIIIAAAAIVIVAAVAGVVILSKKRKKMD